MKTLSIKTSASILMLLLSTAFGYAQEKTSIAVGIAKNDCGDIGYVISTGKSAYSDAEKSAKNKFGGTKTPAVEKNGYEGSKGNYLVIIETTMKGINNCNKHTFGIGYGDDYEYALSEAKKNLRNRNGNWEESKHGYDVKLKRSY